VIVGVGGQARQIVEEAHAGIAIEPENAKELAQAIVQLANDPNVGRTLGQHGREYIRQTLSREQTATKYIEILNRFSKQKPLP